MQPLTGIRVVELASNIAGPFAGLILQDLGATVVKIERPGNGDDVRSWPPFNDGVSAPFAAMNRGKRSVVIDVKTESGLGITKKLLSLSDVFVTSMRPGKASNSGLGWPDLERTHPHLVYAEITGYGPTGPLTSEPGFDAILQAYSGIMALTGYADGPPARVGTGVIDFGTGMWTALGIVATLHQRDATRKGGLVQPSLLGTAVGFLMHHIASMTMADLTPQRIGTAQHNAAPYEALQARDGWIMVGVTSPALWVSLCKALKCPELVSDPRFESNEVRVRNRSELVTKLNEYVSDLMSSEAVALLRASGVPASEIRSIHSLLDDEQVASMGILQDIATGERLAATPLLIDGKFSNLSDRRVPRLGEDTKRVLEEFGWSADETEMLRSEGIIDGD